MLKNNTIDNARIIAIASQKGGVAKSTTTRHLGDCLAKQGKRVLLVDCDPQGSLSIMCDINEYERVTNIAHAIEAAMEGKCLNTTDIIKKVDEMDLLPANVDLASLEAALLNTLNREYMLREVLFSLRNKYDYILIDCPPNLGMLTINALTAADGVIIPVTPELLSAKGLEHLLESVIKVKKYLNPQLAIEGILYTMYNKRLRLTKEVERLIHNAYFDEIPIYETRIPASIKVGEATFHRQSILDYAPQNTVAKAYVKFTEEVLGNE